MTALLEAEVKVGSYVYLVGRLSVFDQMSIATDYRSIIMGLALMKQSQAEIKDHKKRPTESENNKIIQMIIVSPAGMTPEMRNRSMNLCLSVVKRKSAGGWSPILTAENLLQFDDIELPDMAMLLYHVFEHNKLLDFFSEGPSNSDGQRKTGDGQRLATERIS